MAPLLSIKPVKGDRWSAHKKHCTATLVKLKKLATGQQKPRHASLLPAGAGTLPRFGFTAPAFTPARMTEVVKSGGRSATLTPFIAAPLAFTCRNIQDLTDIILLNLHSIRQLLSIWINLMIDKRTLTLQNIQKINLTKKILKYLWFLTQICY